MLRWLDTVPLPILVGLALTLGLAPFQPEPHVIEKLRMLSQGTLRRPVDIFDLVMHGTPWILLVVRLIRQFPLRY